MGGRRFGLGMKVLEKIEVEVEVRLTKRKGRGKYVLETMGLWWSCADVWHISGCVV